MVASWDYGGIRRVEGILSDPGYGLMPLMVGSHDYGGMRHVEGILSDPGYGLATPSLTDATGRFCAVACCADASSGTYTVHVSSAANWLNNKMDK